MYSQKDFTHLLGMFGFSDIMLTNHFTLYGGYVKHANILIEKLDTVEKGGYEYGELKRRLGWEVNGITLHELYFENMTKEGEKKQMGEKTKALLIENYGSVDEWTASIKRNGMIRGIGWVVLVQDIHTGKVFHSWIGEHNVGSVIDAQILLVMDCWEHAYMTDYGIKRAEYVNNFVDSINWEVVEARCK